MLLGEPETHETQSNRYAGVRLLWFRVIVRAAFDVACYSDSKNSERRGWARSARAWLESESKDFNSFLNLCSMLDISPRKVRHWAASLSKEEVSKIEHVERAVNIFGRQAEELLSEKWKNNDAEDEDYLLLSGHDPEGRRWRPEP